jgi:hypothetical protein
VLLRTNGRGYDDTPNQWRGDFVRGGKGGNCYKYTEYRRAGMKNWPYIDQSLVKEVMRKSHINISTHPLSYAALRDPCLVEVLRR